MGENRGSVVKEHIYKGHMDKAKEVGLRVGGREGGGQG